MLVEEIKVQMLRERWGMASPDFSCNDICFTQATFYLPRPGMTSGVVVLVKDEEWVGHR